MYLDCYVSALVLAKDDFCSSQKKHGWDMEIVLYHPRSLLGLLGKGPYRLSRCGRRSGGVMLVPSWRKQLGSAGSKNSRVNCLPLLYTLLLILQLFRLVFLSRCFQEIVFMSACDLYLLYLQFSSPASEGGGGESE